jgi:tRNA A-37 threonylcarbamoyl transferase component Bud32
MKFKKGVATISVEKVWDEQSQRHLVKKQFQTKNKYEREKDFYIAYTLFFDFIPDLIKFDDASKTIWTEYCGISLNIKYPPKERYIFKNKIRSLVEQLENYNLFHNDIRWKNVVENDDGRLFLIDFEVISNDNKERDPEYILRDRPNKK